jgi:hypothetical protein
LGRQRNPRAVKRSVAVMALLALAAGGDDATPSGHLLPLDIVVAVSAVTKHFPGVTAVATRTPRAACRDYCQKGPRGP